MSDHDGQGDRRAAASGRLERFVRRLPYATACLDDEQIAAIAEALYDDIASFHGSGEPVDDGELTRRVGLLVEESRSRTPAIREALEGFANLVDVSDEAMEKSSSQARLPREARHPGIRKAIDMILENYAEELGIESLAGAAALSKSQFMAAFKRETGHSPHEYLRRVRIDASIRLLDSGEDVTRAAFAVGFSSLSAYRAAFVEIVGMRPLEYKKTAKPDCTL